LARLETRTYVPNTYRKRSRKIKKRKRETKSRAISVHGCRERKQRKHSRRRFPLRADANEHPISIRPSDESPRSPFFEKIRETRHARKGTSLHLDASPQRSQRVVDTRRATPRSRFLESRSSIEITRITNSIGRSSSSFPGRPISSAPYRGERTSVPRGEEREGKRTKSYVRGT